MGVLIGAGDFRVPGGHGAVLAERGPRLPVLLQARAGLGLGLTTPKPPGFLLARTGSPSKTPRFLNGQK